MSLIKPGDVLIVVLATVPLAVAGSSLAIPELATPAAVLNRSGRACGILGMSLLFVGALLSVRIPRFDRWFGGLTRLWKVHHVVGLSAFLLLLLHPLLLAFARIPVSVHAAVDLLFPSPMDWAAVLGWLALLTMMTFLAPTFAFFGKPAYQRWKRIHLLSGAAIVFAVAHALPVARSFPGMTSAVWLGLAGLAGAAYLYRTVLARWWGRHPYTIAAINHLAPRIVELSLHPEKRPLNYAPGQFIYLTPADPGLAQGRGEEHPYTLSSAPEEPALRVTIKDLGDATHALQDIQIGSRAFVEGPYGGFFQDTGHPELWVAGGIGITPFMSRARSLRDSKARVDIYLFYCADAEPQAYFLPELQEIAAAVPGLQVWPHYFSREGALTVDFINIHCSDFATREIYLCGPPPMILGLRRQLHRRGVRRSQLHSEEFSFL